MVDLHRKEHCISTLVHSKLSQHRYVSVLEVLALESLWPEARERPGEFSTLHTRLCERAEKDYKTCQNCSSPT